MISANQARNLSQNAQAAKHKQAQEQARIERERKIQADAHHLMAKIGHNIVLAAQDGQDCLSVDRAFCSSDECKILEVVESRLKSETDFSVVRNKEGGLVICWSEDAEDVVKSRLDDAMALGGYNNPDVLNVIFNEVGRVLSRIR